MITNHQVNMHFITKNGYNIRFIKDPLYDLCMAAVKDKGCALKYVTNQTEELCIEAIKNDPYAFQYVKDKTPTIIALIAQYQHVYKYELNITQYLYNYNPSPNEDCMVCYNSNDSWCKLKCGHAYHVDCIKQCLNDKSNKCPYCKQSIF